MSHVKGILVRLRTGTARWAGTDDPLYLGVSGKAGGREFPLDVSWFDDAERLSEVKYRFGEVWDEEAVVGARTPRMAKRDWNDPGLFYLGLAEIDRVYLRKQGGRGPRGDDAYQLDEIEVVLYAEPGERRSFHSDTAVWLGVEYGLQVWIPEGRRPGT